MNSVWTNPRFRAGWKSFETIIRHKVQAMQKSPSAKDEYGWSRLLEESLEHLEGMKASGLSADVFETHRSVVVRIQLPKQAADCRPDISVGPEEIWISGIPGKMDERIKLPASVTTARCKANLSKGILELVLRKRNVGKISKVFKVTAVKGNRL